MSAYAVDLAAIEAARARIRGAVHLTPLLSAASIDALAGRSLFMKSEHLQRGGAFKIRGATNALACLTAAEAARGVVTHSSGNHAQALALAASRRGVPAHIVMPRGAPAVKRAAVESYGGIVHECEPNLEAREAGAARLVEELGAVFIPPYDHPDVIAGQGTVALEILDALPEVDAIIAPVGGGGLLAGIALAVAERAPHVRVFGAEPRGADDAARSKANGERVVEQVPDTIADGLRTLLGELTWPVIRDRVEAIFVVDDDAIISAMRLTLERHKQVVEASGAVALAAALGDEVRALAGLERICWVASGGNVDLGALPFR